VGHGQGSWGSPRHVTDGVVAEGGWCGEQRRAAGAAPVVTCVEEEVGEARNAPRFLEQQRGGPRGHQSRRIDEESPRWHCSPWWGTIGNTVVSVSLNGEGVARGHGGGHPPQSGSSAGRLMQCGGRSVRTRVGRLWWRKADHMRLDRAQKQNNEGGSGAGDATQRQGGERGPASRQLRRSGGDGRRSGGVRRHAGAGERAACVRGLHVSAWAGRGRKELGRGRVNSAKLGLKRISKLDTI
jgi:hypothetical protein